jgi:F5/8 type C domain-containing protein
VSASTHDGNLPANTVDNSLASRWSANGDGQWIAYDLGTVRTVSHVTIAVYNGNSRQNRFDLQVSSDNVNWTNIITGGLTSGTTTAEEIHDFADASARWVRYLGHGATTSTFNSVAEVSLFAPNGPAATPTPTATPSTPPPTPTPTATPDSGPVEITPAGSAVTASTHDGNLPANVVDNSLASRWSANGDGQWLQLDLGTTRTVSHVQIATYNGNTRQSRFDLQVSTCCGTWTNVLTGALTSGTTTAEETFDFADTPARYIRYMGHGNTTNLWNSVTEVSVFGQ